MASKSIVEAIKAANIHLSIKRAICMGPAFELVSRIDYTSKKIEQALINELRDFFAHEVMKIEAKMTNPTSHDLFDRVFSGIPAFKEDAKNGKKDLIPNGIDQLSHTKIKKSAD